MVLLAPSRQALDKLLELCVALAAELDIVFNVKKTVIMVFPARKNQQVPEPSVNLYDKRLNVVQEFKYLGHIIEPLLSDKKDIERACRSFAKMCNMIIRKFSGASIASKITLFKSFCCNLYGCELWRYENQRTLLSKFATVFHKGMKRLVGLPSRSHNNALAVALNLFTFETLVAYRKLNFFNRFRICSNNIVSVCVEGSRISYDCDTIVDDLELPLDIIRAPKKFDIRCVLKGYIKRRAHGTVEWADND